MKIRFLTIVTAFCLISLLTSCAYFNTFHNTKKLFKEAAKEREKRQGDEPTASEARKYDQTIEKASKILEVYPDSKYVDDALFMLGQCFYYKNDFVRAHRKFQELGTFFSSSNLYDESRLWLARSKIKLNDYVAAKQVLTDLLSDREIDRKFRDEGRFLLGELLFEQELYEEAAREYTLAVENAKKREVRAKAFFRLGESQLELEKYADAAESFRSSYELDSDEQEAFEARLHYAKALKLAGEFKEATQICQNLLENETYERQHGIVRLEAADCIYREGLALYQKLNDARLPYFGKLEEAIDEYKVIALDNKRTEVSASAYYHIARIYEMDFGDFAKAKENYDKVRTEFSRSPYVEESVRKSRDLGELIRLSNAVRQLQGEQLLESGSGRKRMSELELLLLEHGAHAELQLMESLKAARERSEANKADLAAQQEKLEETRRVSADKLIEAKIQLAELFLFQFGRVDSAIVEYREIIDLFPEHEAVPKVLYSLAFIYENQYHDKATTDSLLNVLVERFPDSQHARAAQRHRGLYVEPGQEAQVAELYRYAEQVLFQKEQPNRAIAEYENIVNSYPESSFAPRALMAIGWIYEDFLGERDKAIAVYRELIDKYPDSEVSGRVQKKIIAVDKHLDEIRKEDESAEIDSTQMVDGVVENSATDRAASSQQTDENPPTP